MGLFDFVKEAGEKLFGGGEKPEDGKAVVRTPEMAMADREKGRTLTELITGLGFRTEGFGVKFMDGLATVDGEARSQADREKIILLIGNTQGVGRVDDRLRVARPEPEATMYTVQSGDSLSKIAKAHYGDAMKYLVIFEANKPMLKDPDRIYPGQVLRIPPLEQ